MISVRRIYRYPIKGFPGERLDAVRVRKNEGIPGDRTIAIGTGTVRVAGGGAWTPCQAFQRMTIRPDLTTYQISNSSGSVELTSPDNAVLLINSKTTGLGALTELIGDDASIYHAHKNRGYWDHKDAAISIINLSTIEMIAKTIGRVIDPLRFRANIYVRAKPWSEFHWVGQQLDIEDVRLNVIRPIDRCKTTSVDVDTGKVDLNIPALLTRHFGHMYCGIYASVERSGLLSSGQNINAAGRVSDDQMIDAAKQKTSPCLPDWPRSGTVIKTQNEAQGIRSVWIEDTLENTGSLDGFKAGQYIRLHNLSDTHTWRSYTVSAITDGKIRITVKRDNGAGSQAVHKLTKNQEIIISGPFGAAVLNDECAAIHLISAGIGITPTVAKLTTLARQGYDKPVQVTHVARSKSHLALWDDVEAAARKLPNAVLSLYLANSRGHAGGVFAGRPDPQTTADKAKQANADVHICGPTGFVSGLLDALGRAEMREEKIFIDRFNSPDAEMEMRPIASASLGTGLVKVTFARSDISDYWNPKDGTLLDFAESRGVIIPSHCRAGLCKTCKCNILAGSATRLTGERGEDDSQTLLCASVPKKSLILDI